MLTIGINLEITSPAEGDDSPQSAAEISEVISTAIFNAMREIRLNRPEVRATLNPVMTFGPFELPAE